MLQFICGQSGRYSQSELAQMAIEGGCVWIQLRMPQDADAGYLRDTGADLVTMCREASAFLIFEDMPEQAREMGVHGVHITRGGLARAVEARDLLGPEAVVGVELATLADIDAAQRADIDYVSLPASMEVERCAELIAAVRAAGLTIPVVATGDIYPEDVEVLLTAGFSGIAVGKAISESDDPVSATEEFLALLAGAD